MPDLGKYAADVLAAYGASITILIALVFISLQRGTRAKTRLAQLDRQTKRD